MTVKVTLMTTDHMRDEDILEEGDITRIEVEDHQIEKVTKIEGRRGRPPDDRGPPDDGGPLDDGGPPDDGGLPDDGGPQGNGRLPR